MGAPADLDHLPRLLPRLSSVLDTMFMEDAEDILGCQPFEASALPARQAAEEPAPASPAVLSTELWEHVCSFMLPHYSSSWLTLRSPAASGAAACSPIEGCKFMFRAGMVFLIAPQRQSWRRRLNLTPEQMHFYPKRGAWKLDALCVAHRQARAMRSSQVRGRGARAGRPPARGALSPHRRYKHHVSS